MYSVYIIICVVLYKIWEGYHNTGTKATVERIKKPVQFISNDKQLPEQTNLTIYYSQLLQVPVILPSFSTEVIDICYRYTIPSEFEHTPEELEAAKAFLNDRINYTSYLN